MNTVSKAIPRIRKMWLLVVTAIVGGVLLGLGGRTVVATGEGADFADVLNEPARTAEDAAAITWVTGEPLLRTLEPQTIEGVEFAWSRGLSAVGNAVSNDDAAGVDIWFSGPAQDHVHTLLATGTVVDGGAWASHEITPDFYSIDGQILMAHIDRTNVALDGSGSLTTDTVRVVFILRDGNWRIEHLLRVANNS